MLDRENLVALGKALANADKKAPIAYSFEGKNFNYEALQKNCPGANCLHAHEGNMLRNDEIIVYKEEQCTIKYLVELKN